jgi:hypothetical protein
MGDDVRVRNSRVLGLAVKDSAFVLYVVVKAGQHVRALSLSVSQENTNKHPKVYRGERQWARPA